MPKKKNLLGLISGVLVVIFAFIVFIFGVEIIGPDLETVSFSDIPSPEYEDNKYYGGDAYTGMQQASAQAANNAASMYHAYVEGNSAIIENMEKVANAQANNLRAVVTAVKTCVGFVLLSIGLLTIFKNLGCILEDTEKKPALANNAPAVPFEPIVPVAPVAPVAPVTPNNPAE